MLTNQLPGTKDIFGKMSSCGAEVGTARRRENATRQDPDETDSFHRPQREGDSLSRSHQLVDPSCGLNTQVDHPIDHPADL